MPVVTQSLCALLDEAFPAVLWNQSTSCKSIDRGGTSVGSLDSVVVRVRYQMNDILNLVISPVSWLHGSQNVDGPIS